MKKKVLSALPYFTILIKNAQRTSRARQILDLKTKIVEEEGFYFGNAPRTYGSYHNFSKLTQIG
jgi:hypothetical protein